MITLSMRRFCVLVLPVAVIAAFGQTALPPFSASRTASKGEIHSTIEPAPWGRNLSDLSKRADLIVEGVVDASLPSRQPDALQHPDHIETDVVFLISNFIKGTLPSQRILPRIVIAEHGGKVGQLKVVTDEPLLQPGERAILFLQPDSRQNLGQIAGLPRYIIVGVWNGKFKVENGKVSVPAHSLSELRSHHLEGHDKFVGHISAAIAVAGQ